MRLFSEQQTFYQLTVNKQYALSSLRSFDLFDVENETGMI
jgi:hypothetical protein